MEKAEGAGRQQEQQLRRLSFPFFFFWGGFLFRFCWRFLSVCMFACTCVYALCFFPLARRRDSPTTTGRSGGTCCRHLAFRQGSGKEVEGGAETKEKIKNRSIRSRHTHTHYTLYTTQVRS